MFKSKLISIKEILKNPNNLPPDYKIRVYYGNEGQGEHMIKPNKEKMTLSKLAIIVNDLAKEMRAGFKQVNGRLDKVEARLDRVEARLDRVEARLDYNGLQIERIEKRLDYNNLKKLPSNK